MIARRKIAAGVAGLTAAALLLAGCSTAGGASPSAEKVTLKMLVNITPNLTEKFWNDLVQPFEKANPNVTVKIQAPTAQGVQDTLTQLLASGDIPDVVESLSVTKQLAPQVVDLSSYSWAKSSPLAKDNTIDGKIYTPAAGTQVQTIMFYNKKAFADAGISAPPTTVEELTTDLQKLKDAGWVPMQSAGDWSASMAFNLLGLPSILGKNPTWFTEASQGKTNFSKAWTDSVNTYADWVKKGYIPSDQVGIKYEDGQAAFLAGKSAIYPMGQWFTAAYDSAANKPEVGVFAAPAVDGVKPAMAANIANAYGIMKATAHKDAALKLVEYLVSDKAAVTAQLKADGDLRPGYTYSAGELGTALQKIVDATPKGSLLGTGTQGAGDSALPGDYFTELYTQAGAIMSGTSASQALSTMDQWFTTNLPAK